MIPLPPIVYLAIFTLLTMAFGGIQTYRVKAVKTEYAAFVAQVKVMGDAQEKAAQETIQRDQKAKENADAQNLKLRASNDALSRSLLDARAHRGYLSPAAPGSASPDRITFNRAELERAIGQLDAGVSEIVGRCDQARIDLDSARDWIKAR